MTWPVRGARRVAGILLAAPVILAGACDGPGPRKRPSGPAAEQMAARPAAARPAGPDKWACHADADCLNSCKHGAVSRAWYRAQARLVECLDGCANQISGPPRCVEGSCVAFDHRGERREYCTRKAAH